ncbi:MAG: hypothetical protein ACOYY3_07985 [Chloroflexota bacterium]
MPTDIQEQIERRRERAFQQGRDSWVAGDRPALPHRIRLADD